MAFVYKSLEATISLMEPELSAVIDEIIAREQTDGWEPVFLTPHGSNVIVTLRRPA